MKKFTKPIGYETRHVAYCKDKNSDNDLVVINEYRHFEDGRREKHLRLVPNLKRDVWIVKKGLRNFTEKVQWFEDENLIRYETTQANLTRTINKVLGKRYRTERDAMDDPYVFGCGTTIQSEVKHKYYSKYPTFLTPMSQVAVMDTETDVVNGTEEIILCTITMKERVFCAIRRDFTNNGDDATVIENAHRRVSDLLADVIKQRNITLEFGMFDTSGELVEAVINKAHAWQPDFIVFWNMDFDMTKMIDALRKDGKDLANVFSDPRIPEEYRFFTYKRGPSVKLKQDGTTIGLAPYERWHVANCPATFFFACAMNTYYQFRKAKGKLTGGYGLDACLNRHLKLGKLNFTELDGYTGKVWHIQMQKFYKFEYIAYNIFDCIGVELLDEKNKDFALKYNNRCKIGDYTEFSSNPRMLVVKMNYLIHKYGMKLGVTGSNVKVDLDDKVVNPVGWTVVLPSFIIEDSQYSVIKDAPNLKSLMYFHVSDLDISSTYPSVQVALNISKRTCMREIVKVEGLPENEKRRVFVNLLCGKGSAVQVSSQGFGVPTLFDALERFKSR